MPLDLLSYPDVALSTRPGLPVTHVNFQAPAYVRTPSADRRPCQRRTPLRLSFPLDTLACWPDPADLLSLRWPVAPTRCRRASPLGGTTQDYAVNTATTSATEPKSERAMMKTMKR